MGKRILIADDNRTFATRLIELLRRRSFTVSHCADGVTTLRAIAAAPPDLLLLDLQLPDLHGIELLRKLRRSPRTAALPVIILSGMKQGNPCRNEAQALGVAHCLEKPFKAAEILSAIDRLLGDQALPAQPVSHHLREAFRKQFSGQLLLRWPETCRALVFVRGVPVSLQPGFAHVDFGDYLRSRGLLDDTEYDYYANSGAFRDQSLVELGSLAYPDLQQAKLDYLNEELERAFGAAAPVEAVWEAYQFPDLMQVITLNVPNLFYNGFRRFPGAAARQLVSRFGSHFPVSCGDFYRHVNFLDLSPSDRKLLRRMDGRTRLNECLEQEEDPSALLMTLLALDMLRFSATPAEPASTAPLPIRALFNNLVEEDEVAADTPLEHFSDLVDETTSPAPAAGTPCGQTEPPEQEALPAENDLAQTVHFIAKSLEDKNHYEIFGIKPARFSIDLLRERYFAMTRQFGPDVLMQLGGTEAAQVEEILSAVATAYDTLSDVVKKERYDELLDSGKIGLGREGDERFQAQVQAESGKVFIEMEEWDNAEKALQEAVTFDPNNGEVLAHLAWAISRNPRHAGSQAMHNKARQMLNKSLAMERTAQGFAYKGWLLLESGQELMAESEFGKALKLDARHGMARKGLRSIRERQEREKKGLFKRMFQ